MNGVVLKPGLSQEEIERQVCLELCDKAEALFNEFNGIKQNLYAAQMSKYAERNLGGIASDKKLEPKPKWPLKWVMPQEVYHWLRLVKPDGMANFDKNLDFMRWFQKKNDWFKKFELADKQWEDIADGVSTAGGPKSTAERIAMAKKNATVMDMNTGALRPVGGQ